MRINGFVKGAAALLLLTAYTGRNIKVAHDKEQELEQVKQEYFEKVYDQYCEHAKACYRADRALYASYVDSIVSADSLKRTKENTPEKDSAQVKCRDMQAEK